MHGSHSPALDLLRFSTVPSVGFSKGMHCGRGRESTTYSMTHTVCRDPPCFHNLPLQSPGVFSLRQNPKATLQMCFIFSSLLQLCHSDTRQGCVKGTHQSNTVSLIRSHIDGNYRQGKNISIQLFI